MHAHTHRNEIFIIVISVPDIQHVNQGPIQL